MQQVSFRARIIQVGIYSLLWLIFGSAIGYAQVEVAPFHLAHQAPREFVSLVVKKDICSLLDHWAIPPISDSEKRPFFASPTPAQTQMRQERDSVLRQYIDCFRELILVFHRLSLSEKSHITYQIEPEAGSSNQYKVIVEIETSAIPLAETILPILAGKDLTLSFTLTIRCSQNEWKIMSLSKPVII